MTEIPGRSTGRQRYRHGCWLLATVLLFAGCSSLPLRDPAAVTTPAAFSDSGQMPLPDRWWRSFSDPLLDQMVERALAHNFSLQSVWARLDQAAALERIAGAELYPSLDLDGSAARTWSHNTTPSTGNSFSLGAAADYEVDLWGRIESNSEAAALDRQATEAELVAAAVSVADWRSPGEETINVSTAVTKTSAPLGLGLLGIRADAPSQPEALRDGVSGYLLPFEIVSVHLLVVLIGAAYLARTKKRVTASDEQ